MLMFDPMYFLFIAPAVLLAIWAQIRVKSAYANASQYGNRRNVTGAETAREILQANGLLDVNVDISQGLLSDHYDPSHRVLRLSPDVYNGRNLAAVGIAAHEAGHALQHAVGYAPLKLRSGLVPLAMTGGQFAMLFIIGGMMLTYMASHLGMYLFFIGIGLFSIVVLFQLVNLPVEFDASRRARLVLIEHGIVSEQELVPVSRVLNAAALTYVAATLTAIMQLLYFLYRAGLLGGRRH
jgi:Zn-dependent membrane protease YugP